MGQVIDFASKKKELEDKKKKKLQQQLEKYAPAQPFSKTKEPPVQKQVVPEQVEQRKTADEEFDFEKIMKENELRKNKHNNRRSKDNESVKRSYRLKSKREPQG